jgi:hypothetical protein
MTDDRLARLAERGAASGAAALLARVETSLSGRARWRLPGPVLAAVVFAVVIAIGVLGRLLVAPPTIFVAGGIDWHRLETQEFTLGVDHGPGGFVRAGSHVYHSADGESWEEVDPPGLDWLELRGLVHTDDVWLITAGVDNPDHGWVSSDGRSWSPVDLPADLEQVYYIGGGGPLFLAKTNDAVRQAFWISADGASWAPLDVPAGVGDYAFAPVEGGLIWWGDSDEGSVDVAFTPDGQNWSTGSIPPPESPVGWDWWVHRIEQIGERWVAIGESFDGEAQSVGQVWTSEDGLSWAWHSGGLGFVPATWMVSGAGDVLAITAQTSDDPSILVSREVWATNDGESWQKVLEADRDIWHFAVGTDADGELVGVWMPKPEPQGDSGPATTFSG